MSYPHDQAICIRLYHSDMTQLATLHSWMETWLTNYTAWEVRGRENDITSERAPQPEDTNSDPYFVASWWFDWSKDKNIILDALVQDGGPGVTQVTTRVDWARVLYHDCDHPSDEPTPCEWQLQRDYGTVPNHIEESP